MNKEVIKAMKKGTTETSKTFKIHKWWNKNGYKVIRVVFFPLWFCICIKEKIVNYFDSKQKWDNKRAEEILNYYIPRCSDWLEDTKELYYFSNKYDYYDIKYAKKNLKKKDRRFWKVYCFEILSYLIDDFELDGFTKEVLESIWEIEIIFKICEN